MRRGVGRAQLPPLYRHSGASAARTRTPGRPLGRWPGRADRLPQRGDRAEELRGSIGKPQRGEPGHSIEDAGHLFVITGEPDDAQAVAEERRRPRDVVRLERGDAQAVQRGGFAQAVADLPGMLQSLTEERGRAHRVALTAWIGWLHYS